MPPVVRARLILRSPSGGSVLEQGNEPATPHTVAEGRRRLTGLGFEIAAEDPTGIAFHGDRQRFAEVFGGAATPTVPEELAGVAADVVLPRSPELFP